jgi:hypothetical protein
VPFQTLKCQLTCVVFFFTSHITFQNLNCACQLTCNLFLCKFLRVKCQIFAKTLSKIYTLATHPCSDTLTWGLSANQFIIVNHTQLGGAGWQDVMRAWYSKPTQWMSCPRQQEHATAICSTDNGAKPHTFHLFPCMGTCSRKVNLSSPWIRIPHGLGKSSEATSGNQKPAK